MGAAPAQRLPGAGPSPPERGTGQLGCGRVCLPPVRQEQTETRRQKGMAGSALPGGGERVRHIVLITFRPDTPQACVEAVMHLFCRLPEYFGGGIQVECDINNSPEGKNSGFTHCVLMTFTDEAACDICRILRMMI